MSKGLGQVERFILSDLVRWGDEETVESLAMAFVHHYRLLENGLECDGSHECCDVGPYAVPYWDIHPYRIDSVRRAVKSLIGKGLVEWAGWVVVDQETGERLHKVKLTAEAGDGMNGHEDGPGQGDG